MKNRTLHRWYNISLNTWLANVMAHISEVKVSEAINFPIIFGRSEFWACIEYIFEFWVDWVSSVALGDGDCDGETFFIAINEAEIKDWNAFWSKRNHSGRILWPLFGRNLFDQKGSEIDEVKIKQFWWKSTNVWKTYLWCTFWGIRFDFTISLFKNILFEISSKSQRWSGFLEFWSFI